MVYCSTCDGPFYRDKTIAIVGGGSSALEAAIEMSGIAKKVHVVSRGPWSGEEWLKDKAALVAGRQAARRATSRWRSPATRWSKSS